MPSLLILGIQGIIVFLSKEMSLFSDFLNF